MIGSIIGIPQKDNIDAWVWVASGLGRKLLFGYPQHFRKNDVDYSLTDTHEVSVMYVDYICKGFTYMHVCVFTYTCTSDYNVLIPLVTF